MGAGAGSRAMIRGSMPLDEETKDEGQADGTDSMPLDQETKDEGPLDQETKDKGPG